MLPYTSLAQDSRPIVRLIYFIPSDRQSQPDIDAKMDRLIKDVQQAYASIMEGHGFGKKTFLFETGAQGKAVVHHIKGKFNDAYYRNLSSAVTVEIQEEFNLSENIYLIAVDTSSEHLFNTNHICGVASLGSTYRGMAIIPAYGHCFSTFVTAHELGHAFGLHHDLRPQANRVLAYTDDPLDDPLDETMVTSFCAAEWLDAHRAFNSGRPSVNTHTAIKMLPPTLAFPPNAIRLRFKVTDPEGLHQVQLLQEEGLQGQQRTAYGGLMHCKGLNGTTDTTVEFVTTLLLPRSKFVNLQAIDVHGNFIYALFPIDITALLPRPKVVSIPDPNLAAAVRKEIGDSITTHTMLHLLVLGVSNSGITDLTGLEHAHNLKWLSLRNDKYVSGTGVHNNNAVSDFSPLSGLTQLTWLELGNNAISDVSTLAGLTQLRSLDIARNLILDVSPLATLTQLTHLNLNGNSISDVSPLATLTQLKSLYLNRNHISDVPPLATLTQLTQLQLDSNSISDVSLLATLTQLKSLSLNGNSISDMSPLATLTQLRGLKLRGNSISDVSSLATLTQLTHLDLDSNSISDVSPLATLTQLKSLILIGNSISDVSPLATLTQLTGLYLSVNYISDVSPLATLTQLTRLYLNRNHISDVSPLATLTQLTRRELDLNPQAPLKLNGNPLSYVSISTHIPAMQAKGIDLQFDNIAHPALVKISGDTQEGTGGVVLATPFVVKAIDTRGKPVRGVSVTFGVTTGSGKLSATTITTDTTGKAHTLLTLGRNPGKHTVTATAAEITQSVLTFTAVAVGKPMQSAMDINGDGVVNIQDMVLVSSNFGQTGENAADINGDRIVNISDLILVAGALGEGTAAAPALHLSDLKGLTAAEVQDLLTQARQMALTDPAYLRGIAMLEQLLVLLLPRETALLPNYPNPFNPETWIPYQLAEPAEVALTLYGVDGRVVRRLTLGHQSAGMYHSKNRAAYWDGQNGQGEHVASGVYFYTFSAGDFTATRKMLIRK